MQIKCKQAIRLRIEGPTDNKVAFCLEAGCELEAGSSDSAQKAWNSVRLSRESPGHLGTQGAKAGTLGDLNRTKQRCL